MEEGALIFWFHSYAARYEERASAHVGKGSQDDFNDAEFFQYNVLPCVYTVDC